MEAEEQQASPQNTIKNEKYIQLVSRREALEAKIQEKNDELKRLCLAEAELTGIMPSEIPLKPGEPVPTFRRRVGTSFSLPQNLINKLKSDEDEPMSKLELEFQLQLNFVNAAQRMAQDKNVKKSLRRQRHFEYLEQIKRLEYLEEKINETKLSQGCLLKHRKKPRPESRGEHTDADSFTEGTLMCSKSLNSMSSGSISESIHMEVKSLHQYRHHTPLHRIYHGIHPQYATFSNYAHTELDHLNTAFIMTPNSSKYSDSGSRTLRPQDSHEIRKWNRNKFGSLDRKKPVSHSNPSLDSRSVDELQIDEVDGKYPVKQNNYTRRGHVMEDRYYSQTNTKKRSSPVVIPCYMPMKTPTNNETTLLPGQTYPDHNFDRSALTRTQSLGSVETVKSVSSSADTRSIIDMYPATSYNNNGGGKKEKEWFDSSLDSPSRNCHTKITSSESSQSSSCQNDTTPQERKAITVYETEREHFDSVVPFESPKNHMVIQAGKWQPYWESTKPFEMSDFYKYSTKYRKQQQQQQHHHHHHQQQQQQQQNISDGKRSPNQQKGIYQPLLPMTCQPVEVNEEVCRSPSVRQPVPIPEESNKVYPSEGLTWYPDKPRSATLV